MKLKWTKFHQCETSNTLSGNCVNRFVLSEGYATHEDETFVSMSLSL